MRRAAQFLFIAVFLLFLSGCGSQSPVTTTPPTNPTPADVPVSLTVTDTPPQGVTVLFFQLNLTGATLTSSTGGSVSLYPGLLQQNAYPAIPVNVTQLQTDSAFLASANVPAGTYTGLSLTFSSNSQLTIYNGSGAPIGGCANNTVCQLTPSPSGLNPTFNTAPFPITLAANSPLAFMLDIHLNTVIQPDLSVNLGATNGVTVSQLPTPPSGAPISALGNLTGTIQSVNGMECESTTCASSDSLTLQTGDGRTFNINVDSNTTYNYPSSVCSADNFSCLAAQQIVNVALSLQTNGNLLASKVTYVQPPGQMVVEGNIIQVSTSGGNTIIDMISQQGPPPPPTASALPPFGQRVTVTVPPTGVTYFIDSGTFTLPNGLSFTGAADLSVGEEVSVVVAPGSVTTASGPNIPSPSPLPITSPAPTTFTANSITLEPGQITGSVSGWAPISASALTFTLSTYPNYFVPPSATAGVAPIPMPVNITVQATSATTFTNPDSISGLAVGDVVSVKGWFFPYHVIPQICKADVGCAPIGEIAAEAVVGRPGPTPLF